MLNTKGIARAAGVLALATLAACQTVSRRPETVDFSAFVWPPPPDVARIGLHAILRGRADVEADSALARTLLGASAASAFDRLAKPIAVEYDAEGRLVVSDWALRALLRFDLRERKMDVFGTTGTLRLRGPLGLGIGPDGTIYVADGAAGVVIAYSPTGSVGSVYGKPGELQNPTDAAVSADNARLYVADSKAHRIAIFDRASAALIATFGAPGTGEGEFNFPSALSFAPNGSLFVIDQLNARVQVFTADGDYIDELGRRGVGFGNFVRPKDVAIDQNGRIYVTDAAFNNIQIFAEDGTLLTFVGTGGHEPGQFALASGVAAFGDEFAVVDQLDPRIQIFRYLAAQGGE